MGHYCRVCQDSKLKSAKHARSCFSEEEEGSLEGLLNEVLVGVDEESILKAFVVY